MNDGAMMKVKHTASRLCLSSALGQTLAIYVALGLFGLMMDGAIPTSAAAAAPAKDGRVKVLMHNFVMEYAKMSPYIATDKAFTSEKGKEVVHEALKNIAAKIKHAPEPLKESPGFKISYGLLSDHIEKTLHAFEQGEMDLARMRVNGIGNLCASCHMQAPKISHFSAFEFVVDKSKDVSFENAEFLFVIRRYDESLAMLDKLAREYPKSGLPSDLLPDLYRRKLAILARVYRDPSLALENLSTDLKNDKLPMDVKRNIESWIAAINTWKTEKLDPAKMSVSDLMKYVEKSLPTDPGRRIAPGHPQLLTLLRLSGLLYERLYKEPNSIHAQAMLYYLAQCERSLGPLYWYSVSEIYLKECVVQYPKKSFSKKCYQAYRDGMQERYFGKTLPESVKTSLEALQSYL